MTPFKEIEIEDFIWNGIQNDRASIQNRGLFLPNSDYYRQFALPGCGITDILCFNAHGHAVGKFVEITVYELKRGVVEARDLAQLLRHMAFFNSNREALVERFGCDGINIYGILIGSGFDKDVLCLSAIDGYEDPVSYFQYRIDLANGVIFDSVSHPCEDSEIDFNALMPDHNFTWIDRIEKEAEADRIAILNSPPQESRNHELLPF